ncbi:MAG: PKD domain-containing protein, partial [Flavobacteriales bacterium]
ASQYDGCDAFTVDFDGFASDATTWQWQFDVAPFNHSGEIPPLIDYNTPGDHTVTLNVIGFNGCAASTSDVIHVYQSPLVNFTVENLCEGDTAQFFDLSLASPNDSIIGWSWNFDDGNTSTDQNPTNYFTTPGTYDISLFVNSVHCFASDTVSMTIEDAPQAIISLDMSTGCSPITVQFGNNTVNADSQLWDFGDGTTSTDYIPLHIFSNPGNTDTTFMVVMTAMNTFGCGTSDTLYVSPLPSAQAAFTDNSNPPGCSPFAALFFNDSQNADSYFWDLGNGVTSNLFEPTYTYVNTTGSLASYMVSLIAYNDNGCNDTTQHPLIVYPLADFDFTLDVGTAGCSPVVATMPFVAGVQTFAWDFGDGQTSGLATPTHSFVNQTGSSETYTITLIGTSAFGCMDTAVTDITVLPSPVVQFTLGDVSGCSPLNTEIQNISIGADTFDWAYGDGTFSTNADSIHYHSFSNTNSGVANFTITLSASNSAGCSDNFTQSVEVFPQIDASFTDPGEHCSPVTISFVNSSINASGYQWDFGNSFQSIMANPTTTYTNPSDTVQIYDVTLIATSSFGCTDTASAPITINPNPVAAFSLDVLSGCHPLVVNFTNNSFNVDQFDWAFGDGQTSQSSSAGFQHTFENFGSSPVSYTITLNVSTIEGCYHQATQTVTVYPQPIASFVDPGIYCSPATVGFVNTSFNANSYFWDFGNGTNSSQSNPSQLFVNSSDTIQNLNVQLIAISSYGCTDTASHPLVINNKPVAAFTVDVVSGCDPLVVNIINNSLYGDIYNWSFGDGATSVSSDSVLQHTFINTTNGPVYYTIALTLSTDEGCFHQITQQIEVFPHAEANFMDPGEHCAPVNVSFINTSENAQTFSWDFGNGTNSTIADPTAYFTNLSDTSLTLNITLQITSPFGCLDSYSAPLVLHPVPQADFYLSASAACEPGPVTITNISNNATTYNWNYGDGTLSNIADSIHTHDFAQLLNGAAQYEINLVAVTDFGCIDTATAIYSIYPDIIAAFTGDTIDCSPFNASFINQSVGAVSYQWNFGDGGFSSQTSPVHQYTTDNINDVQFTAQLIATSMYGCSDTATQVMQVMHTPAAFALMDSVYGCYPTNVELQNQSLGADSYLWVYGNGITSTTDAPEHTYGFVNITNEIVTYPITLHAYTDYGCFSSDNLSIDVAPPIEADFYIDAEGCTPITAQFDNTSDGGVSYFWDFGDGDMSNDYEPTHTFFNWGETDTTYLVTFVLEDTFGCTDTAYSYVNVYSEPNASFIATPSQQTWPNATISLDNTSSGGTLNSHWDMDDGTDLYVNEPGTYTYSSWGEYQIRLIVSNGGCSDTTFQTIEIVPPLPIANFDGPAEGCVPLTVQFENLSEYAVASEWIFGDGGEANATNPIYTYWIPGTYSVTLTVTGPGGQTDLMTQEQIIHVYPRAHAAFTVVPNEVNVPGEPVYCLNQSQNANSYFWDFGDGSTSAAENPIYYYQAEGEYDILLIANNQYDCPDTLLLESVVLATASGMIDFPNAFTPDLTSSNGGYYDPLSYDNNIFFPMHSGVEEYKLQIFNKWGELLYESNDVNRGWDGYYAGEICPQDVYAWKATALFVDGQSVVQSGDVTLIRH